MSLVYDNDKSVCYVVSLWDKRNKTKVFWLGWNSDTLTLMYQRYVIQANDISSGIFCLWDVDPVQGYWKFHSLKLR